MFQQSLVRNHASLCALFGSLLRGGAPRGSYRKAWLLPLALLALAPSPAYAKGFSTSQKAEIKAIIKKYLLQKPDSMRQAIGVLDARDKAEIQAIIKEYLLQKPEILREAIGVLDARDAAAAAKEREKVVTDPGTKLFSPASQAVVGAPGGKITLVEFFDYNCGYCKRALSDLVRLIKENPDLRIVLRDLPILSADSVEAAKVANAASRQFKGDKFWEFHQKLLGSRHAGKAEALGAAKELGADMEKLEKDAADPVIVAGIEESEKLARALQINGTPTFVIGEDVVIGAVGYGDLQAKLANMKKCGKTACS